MSTKATIYYVAQSKVPGLRWHLYGEVLSDETRLEIEFGAIEADFALPVEMIDAIGAAYVAKKFPHQRK